MLLSRVACDIYWMSRYIERAENIARFLEVNYHLTLDLPEDREDKWSPLLNITGDEADFFEHYDEINEANVMQFMAFDPDYGNSILSCLSRARENARTVRDQLSPEIWQEINTIYHYVKAASKEPEAYIENPFYFLNSIKLSGLMMGGITQDTWHHGEEYHFFRLGRLLERADKTSRLLDVKYFILLPNLDYVGSVYDEIQWSALLRSCSGHETYRMQYGVTEGSKVVKFLMLDRAFPRSIQYCLICADESLRNITSTPFGQFSNPAERAVGQLNSELLYLDEQIMIQQGLHEFIDRLQGRLNEINEAVHSTFFKTDFEADCF